MVSKARHGAKVPVMGRPPKISRAEVLQCVLEVGFAQVTIPVVAERLGVTPATIYRHVPDRQTMLAEAWDCVIDQIEWPVIEGPWRPVVESHAAVLWDVLAEYPGVVTALSSGLMPERTMDLLLRLVVHLSSQGFSIADGMLVLDSVFDTTIDHRLGLEKLDGFTPEPSTSRDDMAASWEPRDGEDPVFQQARQAMMDAITVDPREWIRRKIALILDGAEGLRQLPPSAGPIV